MEPFSEQFNAFHVLHTINKTDVTSIHACLESAAHSQLIQDEDCTTQERHQLEQQHFKYKVVHPYILFLLSFNKHANLELLFHANVIR